MNCLLVDAGCGRYIGIRYTGGISWGDSNRKPRDRGKSALTEEALGAETGGTAEPPDDGRLRPARRVPPCAAPLPALQRARGRRDRADQPALPGDARAARLPGRPAGQHRRARRAAADQAQQRRRAGRPAGGGGPGGARGVVERPTQGRTELDPPRPPGARQAGRHAPARAEARRSDPEALLRRVVALVLLPSRRLLVLQQQLDQTRGAVPALAAARLQVRPELIDQRGERKPRTALPG